MASNTRPVLVWLLAATLALLGGALLLNAAHTPSPPPVYALAAVREGLSRAPDRWLGRTVRVRAVAASPCLTWMGGANPACISWRPELLESPASSAAEGVPLRAASPPPLLAALRRLMLARWLVGAPQPIRWGALTTYRVRLQATSGADCGRARCYAALLLDASPGAQ